MKYPVLLGRMMRCARILSGLLLGMIAFPAFAQNYSENFDDGLAQNWSVASGTWTVSGGTYNSASTGQPYDRAVYNGMSWDTGFSYTSSIYNQFGSHGNKVGVVFNYVDPTHYHEVLFAPSPEPGQTLKKATLRTANGSSTPVDVATATFSAATQFTFSNVAVTRTGNTVTIKLNGTTLFNNVTLAALGAGKIGFINAFSQGKYDNVVVTGGMGAYKAAFPRIGRIAYNFAYEDPSYQAQIARNDVVVLNFFRGWNHGMTIGNAVAQIRARNPNIKLGNYVILESTSNNPNNTAAADILNKLNSSVGPNGGATWTPNDWWAHTVNGGAPILSPGYTNMSETNITQFVTPDANGDRFPQWFAKRNFAAFFTPPSNPAEDFDFCFSDNTFYRPRIDTADFNRDGVADLRTNSTVQAYYRAGIAAFVDKLRQLRPGYLVMANADGEPTSHQGYLSNPEYAGRFGAALLETAFGSGSSSIERFSGWHNTMDAYRSQIDNTIAPHIVLMGAITTTDGKAANVDTQSLYGNGAPYAFMRYVLASALMEDGYVEFHTNYSSSTFPWFDEFDLAGTSDTSWLGTAVDGPQRTAYQNGVYRRRFQNGMAIVNPRTDFVNGNPVQRSAQMITIESGYKRFLGTQAPTVNNGQPITQITLQPGDGIILVKQ